MNDKTNLSQDLFQFKKIEKQVLVSALSARVFSFFLGKAKKFSDSVACYKECYSKKKYVNFGEIKNANKYNGKYFIHPFLPMFNSLHFENYLTQVWNDFLKIRDSNNFDIVYFDLNSLNKSVFIKMEQCIDELIRHQSISFSKIYLSWDKGNLNLFQLKRIITKLSPFAEIHLVLNDLESLPPINLLDNLPIGGILLRMHAHKMRKYRNTAVDFDLKVSQLRKANYPVGAILEYNENDNDINFDFLTWITNSKLEFFIIKEISNHIHKNIENKNVKAFYERAYLKANLSTNYKSASIYYPSFSLDIEKKTSFLRFGHLKFDENKMNIEECNMIEWLDHCITNAPISKLDFIHLSY